MNTMRCHRCGDPLAEGTLKYEVALRVRSLFDGVVSRQDPEIGDEGMARLIADLSTYNEQEADREVYEHDTFTVCPDCKDLLIKDIYSHFLPHSAHEAERPLLIN